MKGRKPTPTFLRLLNGNPGRRPINRNEPTSPPLGSPPRAFTAEQRKVWREVVAAAPSGLLRRADGILVELTVRLLIQSRDPAGTSPALATQLKACLAELGMGPSSRSRLSVPAPVAPNPFLEP